MTDQELNKKVAELCPNGSSPFWCVACERDKSSSRCNECYRKTIYKGPSYTTSRDAIIAEIEKLSSKEKYSVFVALLTFKSESAWNAFCDKGELESDTPAIVQAWLSPARDLCLAFVKVKGEG